MLQPLWQDLIDLHRAGPCSQYHGRQGFEIYHALHQAGSGGTAEQGARGRRLLQDCGKQGRLAHHRSSQLLTFSKAAHRYFSGV